MQLHLKKFDISSIADDKVIILLGKRETGKSFIVRNLLYHRRDMPIGVVISPTEAMNKFYSKIVPGLFIHDKYKPEIIDNVVRRQMLIMKKKNRETEIAGSSKIDPRAFLIMDDCLFDNSWVRDTNIISCFMNGRHFKLMFMITMQHPLGIPPNLRTNIDYVFILRENLVSNRRRIYENYAGMFPTFEVFCQIMDQCTENYECLVINNNAKSNKLEDQVFWFKADNVGDFRMGASQFWTMGGGVESDEDDFDESQFKKKKGTLVNVTKKHY